MSGSVIPVKPGQSPTQLTGTTNPNFTIYNLDAVNAVWVSDSRSVSPGNGMRLGPLANMEWSNPAGDAYACVDTGVLSAVQLNISDDVENVNSPVDVATAVAAQLLAQGIPNVLLTTELFSGNLAGGAFTPPIDVSKYASLTVNVTSPGAAGNVVIEGSFTNPNTTYVESFFLSTIRDSLFGDAPGTWQIPVTNTQFSIFNIGGSPQIHVEIIGSNRAVPKLRQEINSYLPRLFNFTGALAAGGFVQMTTADGIGDNESRFNGPVKLSILGNAASHTAPGFLLIAEYAGVTSVGAGALDQINIFPNSTVNEVRDWYHPPVPVQWWIEGGVAAPGSSITLSITPAGAGL